MIFLFAAPGLTQEEKPHLIQSLSDKNQQTRASAARELAKMGPAAKPAVPYLIKALKDPDLDVRVEVIRALGSIGPAAKDAIPDLFQILKEEDILFELLRHDEGQLIACSALQLTQVQFSAISLQVVFPDVIQWVRDDKARLIRASSYALEEIGPSAVPFLVKQVSGEKVDTNVCKLTTSLLSEFGCLSVSAVPALIRLLDHDNPDVRGQSTHALAWILATPEKGRKSQTSAEGKNIQRGSEFVHAKQTAVAALIKTLTKDADVTVRWAAASALSMQRATPAIPALLDRMEKEQGRRDHFAACLGEIGPEALPAILNIIADERKTVDFRRMALYSLRLMLTPYSVTAHLDKGSQKKAAVVLKKVLKDENEDLRSDAVRLLETIGVNAREAVPDLIESLKDPSLHFRISAAKAIYAIDHSNLSGLPVLIDLLDDDSIRESATEVIQLIAQFGDKAAPAVPKLIRGLNDSNSDIRLAAVKALGKIGSAAKGAIPYLEQAVKNHEELRMDAQHSLEQIKKSR